MTETVVTRLPNAIISFVDNVLYFSYTLDKFSVDEIISKAAKVTSNCFITSLQTANFASPRIPSMDFCQDVSYAKS